MHYCTILISVFIFKAIFIKIFVNGTKSDCTELELAKTFNNTLAFGPFDNLLIQYTLDHKIVYYNFPKRSSGINFRMTKANRVNITKIENLFEIDNRKFKYFFDREIKISTHRELLNGFTFSISSNRHNITRYLMIWYDKSLIRFYSTAKLINYQIVDNDSFEKMLLIWQTDGIKIGIDITVEKLLVFVSDYRQNAVKIYLGFNFEDESMLGVFCFIETRKNKKIILKKHAKANPDCTSFSSFLREIRFGFRLNGLIYLLSKHRVYWFDDRLLNDSNLQPILFDKPLSTVFTCQESNSIEGNNFTNYITPAAIPFIVFIFLILIIIIMAIIYFKKRTDKSNLAGSKEHSNSTQSTSKTRRKRSKNRNKELESNQKIKWQNRSKKKMAPISPRKAFFNPLFIHGNRTSQKVAPSFKIESLRSQSNVLAKKQTSIRASSLTGLVNGESDEHNEQTN